jgi:hypothetical protein
MPKSQACVHRSVRPNGGYRYRPCLAYDARHSLAGVEAVEEMKKSPFASYKPSPFVAPFTAPVAPVAPVASMKRSPIAAAPVVEEEEVEYLSAPAASALASRYRSPRTAAGMPLPLSSSVGTARTKSEKKPTLIL